jgi:hypothetical protein
MPSLMALAGDYQSREGVCYPMTHRANLIAQLQALQADRARHAQAIAKIDATLQRISDMLGPMEMNKGSEAPPMVLAGGGAALPLSLAQPPLAVPHSSRPRKYRKLELTGEEFIIEWIRQHGSATTLEINAAWRAQGRGGVANNAIGRLLRRKQVVREPMANQRGSRYRLPGGCVQRTVVPPMT